MPWEGLVRILKYFKGTTGYGLRYGQKSKSNDFSGFVDASYGRCADTRRSRYGGIYMLNDGPVEWKLKMTQIVALSSMEAEYISACVFVRVGVWLWRCLHEIGVRQENPTPLAPENKSSTSFANEAIIQNRSKHIDTRSNYVREKIIDGTTKLYFVPTKEMPADMLTKPIAAGPYGKF